MKILVATPVFDGKPHDAYCEGLAESYRTFGMGISRISQRGCSDVSLARNTLLAMARKRMGWTVLLWIDADIGFRPRDIELVCHPVAQGRANLVCGIYPKKQLGLLSYPILFLDGDVSEDEGYMGPIRTLEQGNYGRLESAGMGFVAMSRPIVEAACDLTPDYCPWAGFSLTGSLEERHALLFQPTVQIDKRQGIHRFFGEDATGLGILRDQVRAGLDAELLFSFDTCLSHHTSEFSFGGKAVDVRTAARLAAFGNDVMKRAGKGEKLSSFELEQRQARILARVVR